MEAPALRSPPPWPSRRFQTPTVSTHDGFNCRRFQMPTVSAAEDAELEAIEDYLASIDLRACQLVAGSVKELRSETLEAQVAYAQGLAEAIRLRWDEPSFFEGRRNSALYRSHYLARARDHALQVAARRVPRRALRRTEPTDVHRLQDRPSHFVQ